ncbi:MAG: response regulator transcription factor [candidate division Zixibacteria bacterium]|nr:response regulator transcription factor [candidate division Zixibacteria bacterium]
MTRILLADDHKLLIDGLRSLLDKQPALEVVGVAKDGLEATELAMSLRPDVVLLDISMPRQNGIDAARNILRDLPGTKIVMLSMHADRKFIQEALRVGAHGYILKESAAEEVIQAVDAVRKGEFFFSLSVREQVLHDYVEWVRDGAESTPSPLSGREREVLQILAEGKSTKNAAEILHVSVKTIESHRKQIMDKLDLHSIAELTKYAIREGLTPLD